MMEKFRTFYEPEDPYLDRILNQLNSIQVLRLYLFKINFNIVPRYMHCFLKFTLLSRFFD